MSIHITYSLDAKPNGLRCDCGETPDIRFTVERTMTPHAFFWRTGVVETETTNDSVLAICVCGAKRRLSRKRLAEKYDENDA